jgi:hypothetical protein
VDRFQCHHLLLHCLHQVLSLSNMTASAESFSKINPYSKNHFYSVNALLAPQGPSFMVLVGNS